MAQLHAGNIAFGEENRGLQIGQTYGPVQIGVSARPETPPEPSIIIPFTRDPHYIHRQTLFDQIQSKLSAPAGRVALVGLGGVGKSQLAIDYCYRYRDQHPDRWVLWIYASGTARFAQGVRRIVAPNANPLKLFRAWLRDVRHGRWLIILDNVDNASYLVDRTEDGCLFDYLPVCDHGKIMMTSRDKRAARKLVQEFEIVDVPLMDEQHAISLLARKLEKDKNTVGLADLAAELEYMPLALTQAAAFLNKSRRKFDVQRYLEDLRKIDVSKDSLLDAHQGDLRRDGEAANSIILTWQMSFTHISEERESAADMLCFMSLCNRSAIPELLICSEENAEVEKDLEILLGFSFIKESNLDSTFEMHRLVQLSTRRWMVLQGSMHAQVDQLIARMDDVFPWCEDDNRSICEVLYTHARSLIELQPQAGRRLLQWEEIMEKASFFAQSSGSPLLWSQAVEISEMSWNLKKKVLGLEHAETLRTMGNCVVCYWIAGRNRRALELAEQWWEIARKLHPPEHVDLLRAREVLCIASRGLWSPSKVLPFTLETLGLTLRSFGMNRTTLNLCHILVVLRREYGVNKIAFEMALHCFKIAEKLLGTHHGYLHLMSAILGGMHAAKGDSKKAKQMTESYLKWLDSESGPKELNAIRWLIELAKYYHASGEFKMAVATAERALSLNRDIDDPEHNGTLILTRNLARHHYDLGNYDQAVEISKLHCQLRRKIHGDGHLRTLESMFVLATYHAELGNLSQAANMAEDCWQMSKKVLGEEHLLTLRVMGLVAAFHYRKGDHSKAQELTQQCFASTKRGLVSGSFGESLPIALSLLRLLANACGEDLRGDEVVIGIQAQVEAIQTERNALIQTLEEILDVREEQSTPTEDPPPPNNKRKRQDDPGRD